MIVIFLIHLSEKDEIWLHINSQQLSYSWDEIIGVTNSSRNICNIKWWHEAKLFRIKEHVAITNKMTGSQMHWGPRLVQLISSFWQLSCFRRHSGVQQKYSMLFSNATWSFALKNWSLLLCMYETFCITERKWCETTSFTELSFVVHAKEVGQFSSIYWCPRW